MADRTSCRSRLERLIRQSSVRAADLDALLDAEREALKSQDGDALEAIAADKLRAVNDLEALEAERRDLAVEAGFDAGPEGMPALLAWCESDGSLARSWQTLLDVADRCRRRNQSNGAAARVRHEQIRGALAVLSGNFAGSPVYDPEGRESGGTGGRRELARA